jgi:hypothetical protein
VSTITLRLVENRLVLCPRGKNSPRGPRQHFHFIPPLVFAYPLSQQFPKWFVESATSFCLSSHLDCPFQDCRKNLII